ncbi:MAG: hypothetical protein FJ041_08165 [Candidatus Cloacimonetes bacterium]|nr:hypothetical protein [Candidatus Cloacimonadota bacterium]
MKRTFISLIVILLLIVVSNISAQKAKTSSPAEEEGSHGFGIHFGNVSGNGYAYRYLGQELGIQVVVGGFTTGKNDPSFSPNIYHYSNAPQISVTEKGRKYSFNLGGNLIFPLKKLENTVFYLHGGTCWVYSDQKLFTQKYNYSSSMEVYNISGKYETSHNIKSYVNFGAGPGVEMMAGKYFKLVIELPITYTGTKELIMYIPQAGLYYYFK